MHVYYLPSNPRRPRVRREPHRKHLGKWPQNADHTADSDDSILVTRVALC